jgi:hypothetical protein
MIQVCERGEIDYIISKSVALFFSKASEYKSANSFYASLIRKIAIPTKAEYNLAVKNKASGLSVADEILEFCAACLVQIANYVAFCVKPQSSM